LANNFIVNLPISMKIKNRLPVLQLGFVALLLSATSTFAAEDAPKDPKIALNKEISSAANFYTLQQSNPKTAIPDWVVSQAKGVIILDRTSGAIIVGGTAGTGIGMIKGTNGKFSAPAFYSLGGASIGLQIGGGETQTIAFLMSDKALNTLTDSKFVWSGNVRAAAGTQSTENTTADNKVDVILYQQSSGLDAGAAVDGTQVSIDNEGNHKFYDNATITPTNIFAGSATMPDSAKPLLAALNAQTK
jgi:lipid-binding SYLF domain-containing protein